MISERTWNAVLCHMGVRPNTATAWASAFEDEVQPEKFSEGMDDLVDWLPQILHECAMLEQLQENLNYSPSRLCQVWPARFPTLLEASPFAFNPEALANKVYGGRMGNTEPGDGWAFAGKCPIMATGRDAYAYIGDRVGQDLTVSPELILQPHYGLEAAVSWWEGRIPDSMLGDQVKLRRKVNGGAIGMEHVAKLALLSREAFA